MKMLESRGKRRIISEINITPLTDVALVLLIIFMVATPLITQTGFKVKLPEAASAAAQPLSALNVAITADDKIFVNGQQVFKQELGSVLQKKLNETVDKLVVIEADKDVKHGLVVEVLDIARAAGADHLGIATELKRRP